MALSCRPPRGAQEGEERPRVVLTSNACAADNNTIPGREMEPPKPSATGASSSAGIQHSCLDAGAGGYPSPHRLQRKGSSSSSESTTNSDRPESFVSCNST